MGLGGDILITGAGTLTRAILRQARRERWDAHFSVLSRSESRLALLRQRHPHVRTIIGDVRDARAVSAAVAGHTTVIHGAALKRIPECEAQPDECVLTNVLGSRNVADACAAHGVHTAVAISTDKACRAATAYGASKLAMEAIWRAQPAGRTAFVAVRYGNVAASTGSVIPLWRQQARAGKLITLTDARMSRFWMSPEQAVGLIVEAVGMAASGQVVVPKMRALTLPQLAEAVAPGARWAETGLRSTEKLHEDLVHPDEPARELLGHIVIGGGAERITYTSASCPPLSPDEFRAMLADAEDLEASW